MFRYALHTSFLNAQPLPVQGFYILFLCLPALFQVLYEPVTPTSY